MKASIIRLQFLFVEKTVGNQILSMNEKEHQKVGENNLSFVYPKQDSRVVFPVIFLARKLARPQEKLYKHKHNMNQII
jgi:hypothetical protein